MVAVNAVKVVQKAKERAVVAAQTRLALMLPQRVRRATHPQILQGKTHQRQTALRLSAVNAARATVTAATVANAVSHGTKPPPARPLRLHPQ